MDGLRISVHPLVSMFLDDAQLVRIQGKHAHTSIIGQTVGVREPVRAFEWLVVKGRGQMFQP